MNRHPWLATTALTPSERLLGRFLRAPEQHAGETGGEGDDAGDDSSGNQDNNSGNSGDSMNDGSGENNNGQQGTADGFWNQKPEEDAGDDDSTEEGKQLGQELAGIIKGAQFNPVFTKEVTEKIAEGDFEAANLAIAESHRTAMAQSVGIFAKLVSAYGSRIESKFESRLTEALSGLKTEESLEQAIPAYKDPAARPIIDKVFQQSMVNTKGDRAKAIAQTKEMLKVFGQKTGLSTPPSDPNGGELPDASRSLVDELLNRG